MVNIETKYTLVLWNIIKKWEMGKYELTKPAYGSISVWCGWT